LRKIIYCLLSSVRQSVNMPFLPLGNSRTATGRIFLKFCPPNSTKFCEQIPNFFQNLDENRTLDCHNGLQYWTAVLDCNTGLPSWTAILDCNSGLQLLDCNTGLQFWTTILDGNTGLLYWTAVLDCNTYARSCDLFLQYRQRSV
jgi:hypothetical protein